MMPKRLLNRIPRTLVVRYLVLGAAALSVLPATPVTAQLFAAVQEGADSNGRSATPPKIHTQPFKDLFFKVREMLERGEIDLARRGGVRVETDVNEDGSLAATQIFDASDERLKQLASEFALALSDSRFLALFKDVRHLEMGLALDGERLAASATAEVESEKRAAELASGYGALITVARFKNKGRETEEVWNNMTFSANGKQLAMKLEMSRQTAGNLLLKQITPN